MGVLGYERPDGSVGIRNHVVVIASVACANGVVEAVTRALPRVKPITHTEGCGRGPKDLIVATRTLCGLGKNPNVAGVLVVGLGCEFLKAPMIANEIASSGKPVERLVIQENGGSQKTTEKAIELARTLLEKADVAEAKEFGWERLTVGLDVGGLGLEAARTANPALGVVTDWVVDRGGRVLVSASNEVMGDSKTLRSRSVDEGLAKKIESALEEKQRVALEVIGRDDAHRGDALSSFGARAVLQDMVDYGEPAKKSGLTAMDTPESDVYALTGMAAGGAQLFVQTTERGTPGGFPIVPLVKVSTSTRVFEMMEDDIDFDAGRAANGATATEIGDELVSVLERVAGGEHTKAEAAGYDLVAIYTQGTAF